MFSVALIGADGAGKTTVAQKLEQASPVPVKYLYMGTNIESSNIALPWSRLVLRLKLLSYKRTAKRAGITDPGFVSTHHSAHRSVKPGPVRGTLRLINRLVEGWYRQLVSWNYQRQGTVVVYDRHLLFDAAPPTQHKRRLDRLYYFLLTYFYPDPDLVIFLDAPPEVLFARKGEATLDYLRHRQQAFLAQGEKTANFIRVDASQPLETVLAEVTRHIMGFYAGQTSSAPNGRLQNEPSK